MNIMHPVLRRIDLNLLPVFDAVYRSRSVRLAAEELAMSTSALSHALSRLRSALNDPLFYREGHRMCPSVYASQLAPSIASALKFLNQELTPPAAFVPAASTDCMQIAITDFTAFCVFPTLMHHLQREAPGLRFELRYLPHSPALTELLAGEVDLALGFNTPDEPAHPDLEEINWLRDEYVVISQANRTALTLDAYLAARHLVVTPWNERQGVLDCELERQGYSRQVAIAFHEGDPDRPYIAHALHDSRHVDPVTEKNSTRNVIRTPTNNKLRMEDKRGEEHIKLSTEYGGKTQLNLGHNVNAQRELRGEGAELRTDKWVSIRGGAGVFISADKQPSAGDRMLAMEEAIAQLENALGIAKSLASAAESAQALPSDTGNQQTLNDALKELAQPGIVLNAPQGVSISSPQAVRLSSGSASVGIVSQQNTDISALKRFTVAAGEAVSLLARKAGMKLFAAKGKIEIQAQDDALEATAKKDITVTSVEGRVEITAAEELVVNCAGAYIRLSGGNIELGCPGNILLKSANVQKMGAADYDANKPELPVGFSEFFTAKDEESGEILPFTRYRITTGEGKVFEGRTDAEGKTVAVYTALPDALHIELL